MSTINFIGGEKGGVGKSMTARILAQYYIDHQMPFQGFDTDRSHQTFKRFYEDFTAPIIVDSFEALDQIVHLLESNPEMNIIVDLAAQTSSPLTHWMQEANLMDLLAEMGVTVNFWHLMDDGKDSIDLLEKLTKAFGTGPNYIVVQNKGRGTDFSNLHKSEALKNAINLGAQLVELPKLYESTMRKIDQNNMSFWRAMHLKAEDGLGIVDRQRVKLWLKNCYGVLGGLPVQTQKFVATEPVLSEAVEAALSPTPETTPL